MLLKTDLVDMSIILQKKLTWWKKRLWRSFPFVSLPCKGHRPCWVWIHSFLPILLPSSQGLLTLVHWSGNLTWYFDLVNWPGHISISDSPLDVCPLPKQSNVTFLEEEKQCSYEHQGKPSLCWKSTWLHGQLLLSEPLPQLTGCPTQRQPISLDMCPVISPQEPCPVNTLASSLFLQHVIQFQTF